MGITIFPLINLLFPYNYPSSAEKNAIKLFILSEIVYSFLIIFFVELIPIPV